MRQKLHLLLLAFGVMFFNGVLYAAAPKGCFETGELLDFKKTYIELQQKLNYEGQDAYLDKNNHVQLKAHQKGQPYPGKEFEAAMFAEYQNSLRKVGRLFQSAKFEDNKHFKSNTDLLKFMAAIEKADPSEYVNNTDIDKIITELRKASAQTFGSTDTDKKYVITAEDEILLKKLLTHAQDRICNLVTYNKTGKPLTSQLSADDLKKVKNAPLNQLIQTLKSAPIKDTSKIDLMKSSDLTAKLMDPSLTVDPAVVINSAVAADIEKLSQWVKKVKDSKDPKCFSYLKTKDFANTIQLNIQSCNLGEFLDTMSKGNASNLEAVLHFINANEKFLKNPQAKAETALDEVSLEGFISTTFEGL
ncbi:MAG: hypothetical protein K2Q18_03520, partial [Bdellovibrionales bacterium]|nr:hypothetical protein [Bdellovibrionales bacterium]